MTKMTYADAINYAICVLNGEEVSTEIKCNEVIEKLEAGETFDDRVVLQGKLYTIDNAQESLDAGEGF